MLGQAVVTTTLLKYADMWFVQVPLELKALLRANFHKDGGKAAELAEPAEIRHLQEAVCNYMTVSHVLWPFDYAPLVLLRVLIENRWGEAAGGDMRERVALVSKFFNDVVSENSGRAVRGEPPLDYEKTRGKWARAVELAFPQLSYLNSATTAAGGGGGSQQARQGQRPGGNGTGGGKPGGSRPPGGGSGNPRAMHNGRAVCFQFNQREGCKRQRGAQDACRDPTGTLYAHYCNFFDKRKGAHCLAMHPRCANH